jgi:Chain length determinant protein
VRPTEDTAAHERAQAAVARTRWQAIWAARWIVLGAALAAAVLALAVSAVIPKRFSASAIVRVTLPQSAGLSEQSVQAANDLASQYTQIATAGPIVAKAAASLGPAGAGLSAAVSASTVNSENLVQISARGDTAGAATARANAMAAAFVDTLNGENAANAAAAAHRFTHQLDLIQARLLVTQQKLDNNLTLRESGAALNQRQRAEVNALQNEVTSLEGAQQTLLSSQVSTGTPTLKLFSPSTSASQTQPRAPLYALVAFIVVLLSAAQIASFIGMSRSETR